MDQNDTRSYTVNFAYGTITEMLEKTLGFNPDGSINVTYSLTELQNILSKNLECIDKLLKKTGSIKDIQLWNTDSVRVEVVDPVDAEWLLENRAIVKIHDLVEEEKSYDENEDDLLDLEYLSLDNVDTDNVTVDQEIEEKTEDTFKRIFRATSLDQHIATNSDDEDPDVSRSDSDEVVSDPHFVNKIMDKYAVVADAMNAVYDHADNDEEFNPDEDEDDTEP